MSNPFRDGQSGSGAPSGSTMTVEQLRQKEIELDRREQQIEYQRRKLGELKEVASTRDKPPNWPSCRPLIYHNIREEIPENGRILVTRVYFSWFLYVGTLVVNCAALLGGLAAPVPQGATGPDYGLDFGLSIVLLVITPVISFVFWYRPFYVAVKNDRSISYFFFFFNYACHLLLCIVMAIGIPSSGGGGFINAFRIFKTNVAAGIVLLVSSGAWCLVSLFNVYQMQAAIRFYRGQGHTVKGDATSIARDAASSEAGQAIAIEAGKAAVAGAAAAHSH